MHDHEMEYGEIEAETLPEPFDIRCIGCGKSPDQIGEYVAMASDESQYTGHEITPTAWMQENEGTYNVANGHFACTACYLRMGAPTSPTGWKAP